MPDSADPSHPIWQFFEDLNLDNSSTANSKSARYCKIIKKNTETERQTDRQTDKVMERQRIRKRERWRVGETERWRNLEIERQTD
jgi:hypothetical protein